MYVLIIFYLFIYVFGGLVSGLIIVVYLLFIKC